MPARNPWIARIAMLAVAALSVLSLTAASAQAKAPRSFYGLVPQTLLSPQDFDVMGQGKVGSVRVQLNWASIDATSAADDFNWGGVDAIVAESARNKIQVLPFVFGTPDYVAKDLDNQSCSTSECAIFAPRSPAALAAFSDFMEAAAARYGRSGTFWTENPNLPKKPIKVWQIWNEMNSSTFYAPKPRAKSYAKLLAAADRAVAAGDPSADIVLGGIAELAGSSKAIRGSKYLKQLYRVKGAKKTFDGVAPHPYGATVEKAVNQVDLFVDVIKQAGDSGADLYISEIGWGSAKGGHPLNRGKKGQAERLTEAYKYFAKQRNKLNIRNVAWFSYEDSSAGICDWCDTSGLFTAAGKAKPSWKAFTKLTGGR